MSAPKNYYQILGVETIATQEEIKAAYRRLARMHHPDKNQNDPKAEVKMKEINEAYGVLSDPQRRAQYDLDRVKFKYCAPAYAESYEDIVTIIEGSLSSDQLNLDDLLRRLDGWFQNSAQRGFSCQHRENNASTKLDVCDRLSDYIYYIQKADSININDSGLLAKFRDILRLSLHVIENEALKPDFVLETNSAWKNAEQELVNILKNLDVNYDGYKKPELMTTRVDNPALAKYGAAFVFCSVIGLGITFIALDLLASAAPAAAEAVSPFYFQLLIYAVSSSIIGLGGAAMMSKANIEVNLYSQ